MTPTPLPTSSEIRDVLSESSRGPLKAKEIARSFEIPQRDYRRFRNYLRKLERTGELYRVKGNRYAVPEKINLTVGKLQVTRAGDAFLRPDSPKDPDVFVPGRNHESAMDGDHVAVRIEDRPRGRAPVGRVVKVLERARESVVGTFHQNREFGFVTPLDRRVTRDILIGQEKRGDAEDGDVVVVRITQFGDSRMNATGAVERVLGAMDDPGVDVLAILHGHGLPQEFPKEVEAAAREAEVRVREPGKRVDLTDLLVFTIDPPDAKDHDDALSVVPVGDGVWEVGVHIADVSHFVEEGGLLDLEAYRRGTSVYLVDQVVPMLPHRLSADLCSLTEGEDRLAVSLFLRLDERGRVRDHRFERTRIRSSHSLNYDQAHAVLAGESSIDAAMDEALHALKRLADVQRERRSGRGSLDFDLPEARVVLDEEGTPIDIQRLEQLDSHRLIEDFMILANEVVARDCESRKLPIPYRVHEAPADDRIEELRGFLSSVGHTLPRGKSGPGALQSVLDKTEGRPEAALIRTVILKSMSRARYDPENVGHFGLASKAYAHFTSPIRRYPDLALHRVVTRCLIEDERPLERWSGENLEKMTVRASEREQLAQRAERDSIAMKKIEFMLRHLSDEFEGTIAGVTAFGFFVLLDRFFVEGLVHVSSLGDDYYNFVSESYALVGRRSGKRFRLGDRVRVRVARVNKEEREIDFTFLERLEGC
ncbi:MAG: ribonuclease R [Gemmatimonadota bacterium]